MSFLLQLSPALLADGSLPLFTFAVLKYLRCVQFIITFMQFLQDALATVTQRHADPCSSSSNTTLRCFSLLHISNTICCHVSLLSFDPLSFSFLHVTTRSPVLHDADPCHLSQTDLPSRFSSNSDLRLCSQLHLRPAPLHTASTAKSVIR